MSQEKICAWCHYARMRSNICGIYCTGGFENPDGTCGHFRDSRDVDNDSEARSARIAELEAQLAEQQSKEARNADKLINDMEKYKHLYNGAMIQLAESQRREQAAVKELDGLCPTCKKYNPNFNETCSKCGSQKSQYEWRGV